ncbi:hypothetical protein [Cupriavidus taiwanensis]|uniref:Transposase n=1 Tax=Cupriavidus taiwanensis TaxID=164546 RepID=A0A375HFW9_9BURK
MPRRDFDAHRPLRGDENLERIFSWREWRKVSASLTLEYDKGDYLLEVRPDHRPLIHRYLEVAEYPDGRIALWGDSASLPYATYDRLGEIDQGEIVDNKRLGHVLAITAQVQAQRDSRQQAGPSRTLQGEPARLRRAPLNVKRQRLINRLDRDAIAPTPIPQMADILTLPTANQPPYSRPDGRDFAASIRVCLARTVLAATRFS